MEELDDLELVARFLTGGDREALGKLLARYRSACYGLALHVTRSVEDAEDACQEAAARAVRALEGFNPSGSFRAWFLRITYSAAVDLVRRRGTRREKESLRPPARTPGSPAQVLERAELGAAMRTALRSVEPRYRMPVVLRYEQGLSYREAAGVLDMPEGTVRTYASRGIERLRQLLVRNGHVLAPAAAAGLLRAGRVGAPATLEASFQRIAASASPGAKDAAGGAGLFAGVAKGGITMKIIAGVVLAGAVAAGMAVVSGRGGGLFPAEKPPKKVPGKDYPYGDGVIYKREVFLGSFSGGYQDGPGPEIEGGFQYSRAASGDWYLLHPCYRIVRKYDVKKKRVYTVAWAGPYGKQGGLAECARFGGGGYHHHMGLSADSSGKFVKVFDRNNGGVWWKVDPEKSTVEPTAGADKIEGAVLRGGGPGGAMYFAKDDARLKKLLSDGTVQDMGVTLEQPIRISTFFGNIAVNEELGRVYAASRDPHGPWGVIWYWDLKTGKGHWVAGPKKGQPTKGLVLGSGPADKIRFWCGGGPGLGPDRGKRFLYYSGGDESTCSRIDLEKSYVHKLVKADPKGDRSLWHFGEGRQNKDYRFGDPYNWAGAPFGWNQDGEFYMLCSGRVEVFTPVKK